MQLHIGKLAAGLTAVSVVLILGTTSLSAATTSVTTPPIKAMDLTASQAPSVQLPVEEPTIDLPLPSEELALGYGFYRGYYGGYGYGFYPRSSLVAFGYRSYPYRSFGLSYYRTNYPGYSFFPPSYYYPGSYYSYAYRPSYFALTAAQPLYYGAINYRPRYYGSVYYSPVYRNSFYGSYISGPALFGGYGYGMYGSGYCGY